MNDSARGVAAIVAACSLWGLSGLYFGQIREVPALEVLAYRVVWTVVFFLVLFTIRGRLGEFRRLLSNRELLPRLALSTVAISVNWFGYIWAIGHGHATEASLGYYIFPLLAVLLGFVVFGERFSRLQSFAVALAVAAVLVLSVGLGAPPWISLLIAGSFGIYGVFKKAMSVGPVISVAAETALLLPVALAWLAWLHLGSDGAVAAGWELFYLPLSAFFTGLPLVLFSYASKRLAYATLGLVQYMNPTLQFTVAMIYFGEPFGLVRGIAFPLIWAGVALYCLDLWRQDRRARRSSRTASAVSTT